MLDGFRFRQGVSGTTNGLMSLGLKNTTIHTCIGSRNEVIEEVKVSLLDANGVVQNIKTQVSDKEIGPDRLKHKLWYSKAFEQLGVPENMQYLFDIPREGGMNLLIGQNTAGLVCSRVNPEEFGFTPTW